MTDQIHEQISAAVDGELPAAEAELLGQRLASDAALRARWERYHLISDALNNHLPPVLAPEFSERVMRALENEPVPAGGSLRTHRLLKPVAGVAIAASVAVLAVFSLQNTREPTPLVVRVAEAPPAPVQAPAPTDTARVAAPEGALESAPRAPSGLNEYLLSHSGHAANPGVQGVLPYVRIVGYEQAE